MNNKEKKARIQEIRDDIRDYVIPVNTQKTSEWLGNIEKRLKELVIGQDRAIEHVIRRLGLSYSGLKDPVRPIGSLILLGPTGTGKTYLTKTLADKLLGGDGSGNSAVIIECANLQDRHSVYTLIGAPPGYLGHGDPPVLSQGNIDKAHLKQIINRYYRDEIKRSLELFQELSFPSNEAMNHIYSIIRGYHKPMSVIVFDEIEEAHPNIISLLLNVIEEGKTTLADGSITDFSNSIIILTSNLGSREIKKLYEGGLGFRPPHEVSQDDLDLNIYEVSKRALEKDPRFPPKFIGRVRGDIIVFRSLTRTHFSQILDLMLDEIQRRVSGKRENGSLLLLNYSRYFKKFLLEEGIDPEYGARNLRAVVEKRVSYEIGQAIGSGQLRMGDKVLFKMEEGKPVLRRKQRPKGTKLPEFKKKKNGKKVDLENKIRKRLGLPPKPLLPSIPSGPPKRPVEPVKNDSEY